ncbi:hypothetical protein [Paraburkholderia youngii]|uniref:hypothetical protein n=1 Tax=Paraburkholderia youngii TaxID=2782701 RepID=UPI001C379D84|nr:hypothetical protein [Paraburkholderia youngii]
MKHPNAGATVIGADHTVRGCLGRFNLSRSKQMLNVEWTGHGDGPVRPGHARMRARP